MVKKNNIVRNIGIVSLVLIAMVLIVFLVGKTFGFFSYAKKGEVVNVITINGLAVNIINNSDEALNIANAYPMYDSEGLTNDSFDFTITNTSSKAMSYTLKVVNDSEKQSSCVVEGTNTPCTALSTNNIKYSYKLNNGSWSTPANLGANNDVAFDSVIRGKATVNVSIVLWIDSEAGNSIQGQVFFGSLILQGGKLASNQHVVTLDANGGTVTMPTKVVTTGSTYQDLPTPTRDGYTFKGWSLLTEDGYSIITPGYRKVEYIESTGTQYIDMGITPNENTKVIIDFDTDTINKWIFGSRSSYGATNTFGVYIETTNQYWAQIGGNGNRTGGHSIVNTTLGRHIIEVDGSHFIVDGEEKLTYDNVVDSTDANNLYLFGMYEGTVDGRILIGKVYSVKIYKNNNLVRDFAPCVNDITNKTGLYDLVDGAFYGNDGTGSFETGGIDYYYLTSSTEVLQNQDHTLTAIWEKNPFTTNFNANGGAVSPTSKTVKLGNSYGELPTPTREGYMFKGWHGKNMFNILDIIPSNSNTSTCEIINDNQIFFDGSSVENNTSSNIQIQAYLDNTYISDLCIFRFTDGLGSKECTITKNSTYNNIRIKENTSKADSKFMANNIQMVDGKKYTISFNLDSYDASKAQATISNFQIEEGTTATAYEPYYITSSTKVVQEQEHTLTAIWEQN